MTSVIILTIAQLCSAGTGFRRAEACQKYYVECLEKQTGPNNIAGAVTKDFAKCIKEKK